MKTLFVILSFILLPVFSFGQKFELKQPDVKKIRAAYKQSNYNDDEILIYLKQNYKPVSKPSEVMRDDEFDNRPICSFRQKFEGGIEYFINECGEGKGLSMILTLPKTDTASVKKWIEKMYLANGTEMDNVWDKSGLIYQPKDEEAGCYYQIKQSKNKTVIDMYCGC